MMSDNLPSTWQLRTLRELHAGGISTADPMNCRAEKFEYYSIPAYQQGSQPQYVVGKEILSQKLLIPARCLLFGKLNPRVEKVWNVQSSSPLRRLASTEWLPLVPVDELDQCFGYFLLWSEWVMPVAKTLVTGSTPSRQRVEPNSFYDIEVPLPPIAEQRAIASLLHRFKTAIEAQDQVITAAQRLKTAAASKVFAVGLRGEALKDSSIGTIPQSWDVVPLGSLGRVGNGSTPKKDVREYWEGGTFPWLTSAKVYDRDIDTSDQYVTALALRECHLPQIGPGAVLVAITGQGKTLGHCAVLRVLATINQHIAYVALEQDRIDPSFIRGYLETQYDYFRQVGSGGGSTKGALTCSFLKGVPVPLPTTLDEQQEIAGVLDAIDLKIDAHRKKRSALEQVFKRTLNQLLNGTIRICDVDKRALTSQVAGVSA